MEWLLVMLPTQLRWLKNLNGAGVVAAGIGGGRGEAAGRIPTPRLSNLRAGGANRRPVRLAAVQN